MAHRDDGVFGGDFTVGLDTEYELGNQRVRNLRETELMMDFEPTEGVG